MQSLTFCLTHTYACARAHNLQAGVRVSKQEVDALYDDISISLGDLPHSEAFVCFRLIAEHNAEAHAARVAAAKAARGDVDAR
jgi:hypothetical protein